MYVVVARQPALQRALRDDDRVVAIHAEGVLALGPQQADDVAGDRPQPQAGADGILRTEQGVPRGLADDADGCAGAFALREPATALELPVARLEVGVGRSGDRGRPVALPLMTLSPWLDTGATAVTAGTSRARRSTSCWWNGFALPDAPPGPVRWPGITVSRLLPRFAMSDVTTAVAPLPSVTMMITEATPMMIPRAVSDDRRTFRRISRNARMMALKIMTWGPPVRSSLST